MKLPEYRLEYLSESWNPFGKLFGARSTCMQSKVDSDQDDGTTSGSKEGFKDGVFLSLSQRLPNLEDEIHLTGGRIVTP